MRVVPLGEQALLLYALPIAPSLAARRLRGQASQKLLDVVSAYDSVAVYFEGDPPSIDQLQHWMVGQDAELFQLKRHIIPVCYELGEDLSSAAVRLGISPAELIYHHTSTDFTCHAVGFCPGFPYLGYLPEEISGLGRLSEPRVRVPVGTVAITGRQTGIYPLERPGGWWLLGRTPLVIVDEADNYFPIEAGDSVRFSAISEVEFWDREGERLP